jgi:hypothetical protein
MSEQISDAPLVHADHDPASIQLEVMRLREQCRRLLEELERRYEHLRALPRRIKQRVLAAPRAVRAAAGRHKILVGVAIGAALCGAAALLVWQRRRRAWYTPFHGGAHHHPARILAVLRR